VLRIIGGRERAILHSRDWPGGVTLTRVSSGPRQILESMIEFEFAAAVYWLTDEQATVLAENLRNYAKGTLPRDVELGAQLSGKADWTGGALALADFIEEILVGNLAGPLPLAGKAAESMSWALRVMQGVARSRDPSDMAALRDGLAQQFVAAH